MRRSRQRFEQDGGRGERGPRPADRPGRGRRPAGRGARDQASRSRSTPPCPRSVAGPGRRCRPRSRRARVRGGRTDRGHRGTAIIVRVIGLRGATRARPHEPCAGAGASGASDSSKRSHGDVAEQRADAAARADLDDRERPAELAEARADRPRPRSSRRSPRRSVPSRLEDRPAPRPRRASSAAVAVVADGRDPDVDGLDPGIGRDHRVRRRAAAPRRASRRPAIRRSRSAGRSAPRRRRPSPGAWRRGQRLVVPHRPHLARRAGQRDDDPPVRAGDTNQPGAVPFGLGSASADGISQACLRLSSGKGMPRRPTARAASARGPGRRPAVSPQASAIASRVRSSGVGPRPPVETTRSARAERRREAPRRPTSSSSGRAVIRPTVTPSAGQRPRQLARRSCRASRRRSAPSRC